MNLLLNREIRKNKLLVTGNLLNQMTASDISTHCSKLFVKEILV